MKKVFTIGLTGGMATGKSTITNYLREKGYPVFDADDCCRTLLLPASETFHEVVEHFGENILNKNGTINRALLAEIVFANVQELKWLESVQYQRTWEQAEVFLKNAAKSYDIAFIDAPLLIEAGWNMKIDALWLVFVSEELQIQRAMQRDNISKEAVQQRLNLQMNFAQKALYATDIIDNSQDIATTLKAVDLLLCKYKERALEK